MSETGRECDQHEHSNNNRARAAPQGTDDLAATTNQRDNKTEGASEHHGTRNSVVRYQPGHRDGAETDQPRPRRMGNEAGRGGERQCNIPSVKSARTGARREKGRTFPNSSPKRERAKMRAAPQIVRGTRQSIAARKAGWVA